MEELLKIAKENYPAGTVFKSAFDPQNTQIVEGNWENVSNGIIVSPGATYIYYKENWAEIISKPEECKKLHNCGDPADIQLNMVRKEIERVKDFHSQESKEKDPLVDLCMAGHPECNGKGVLEQMESCDFKYLPMTKKSLEEVFGERFEDKPKDPVNPSHYSSGKIECIDAIESALSPEEFKGFLRGNVLKYNWRCMQKNGVEDLKKAQWYLNRLIKTLENVESKLN